ncbi:MAG: SMC-Scp complex subunit ScpB, partial [Myxococcota bacterium]
IIFAVGEPVTLSELKKICARAWKDDPPEQLESRLGELKGAVSRLKERWSDGEDPRGFELVEVAEGFSFRSNPMYADYLRAMRDERPVRLSKAALETLSIVAYRQPATKPEIDHIRGVDCGGTLRLLIDRNLVRIVGKKEEPGRPLLYGTSKEFLSFFNISNLNELPSLREYHELNEESKAELDEFDGGASLEDLSRSAKQLRLEEEPAVQALDEAVQELDTQESVAVDAFASQGIEISPDEEDAKREN